MWSSSMRLWNGEKGQKSRPRAIKIEQTAWHKKEHATFSDMLRAVRMAIWQGNLIPRKAKTTPSGENITPEMAEWAEAIVRQVLQAA